MDARAERLGRQGHMTRNSLQFFVRLMAVSALCAAQARADADPRGVLSVRIVGVRNDHGRCGCALFDSENGFPKDTALPAKDSGVKFWGSESLCRFAPITAGKYAVACFHDENANGKCDTGFLGIPTEGTVVSNEAKGFMGPASFKDARFSFSGRATELRLRIAD